MEQTKPPHDWIGYQQMRLKLQTHAIMAAEIPTEHYVSILMPTLRAGMPGYAMFASPARRISGEPLCQGTPDRWCIFNALNGRLLFYALTRLYPMTNITLESEIILPPLPFELNIFQQLGGEIDSKLHQLAPLFFAGSVAGEEDRSLMREALGLYIPSPLHPLYEALAPDFYAWLAGH